ncbi:MAG: peptidoglycan -binding protein [Xanthomonadales bacterium]|nr:peptidoglycan -binding protein [Xanthomonadales bacterium]
MAYARRRSVDIWPGFVDALAALLMVVIFVLLLFTLGQFLLTDRLSGREQVLAQLQIQVAELSDMLALEQTTSADLQNRLGLLADQLGDSQNEAAALAGDVAMLQKLRDDLEAEVAALAGSLDQSQRETSIQTELTEQARAQVVLLNRQIQALRSRLAEVASALELAESQMDEKDREIEDLGNRLNVALASQVKQLAQYRSEFFGRLKQALGEDPNLRIEGDRFVFQSELLFASGSATLGDQGRAQVRSLVNVLNEITPRIPNDIDWVLRVDGHTDRRPITTNEFPSNWELSTARSLAIVKYMIQLGINPRKLAATGFGEFHPLAAGDNEISYARNRRIELKLTSR